TATLAGDAALRAALAPPHWVDAGHLGAFTLRRDARARGPVWTVPGASATVGRPDPGPQGSSSMVVSARAPVEVVRSVAWAPGWSAELTAAAGTTRSVPVTTRGVLQEAKVPAGVTRVHWVYRAPRLRSALALAAAGALALIALAVAGSRRRRLSPPPPPGPPTPLRG
ncbi:MAG: hypothetical protein ACRD0L_03980, partial [Acidimicrobiales bacterium]